MGWDGESVSDGCLGGDGMNRNLIWGDEVLNELEGCVRGVIRL